MSLYLDISARARPIEKCVVLQRTLAASVADGAVERMVYQQELENTLPVTADVFRVRVNNHVIICGKRAAGLRLRHHFYAAVGLFEPDVDEAHPTHTHRLHPGVIAEYRNFQANALDAFDDQLATRYLDFNSIYC